MGLPVLGHGEQKSQLKVFVEGYGCSANLAETEQIKGFFRSQSALLVENPSEAGLIVVNSCGVKRPTEFKMKRRVEKLKKMNSTATVIVSGCLPKINPSVLAGQERVVQTRPELKEIAKAAGLAEQSFSPTIDEVRLNPFVSMIPISKGCLSSCSFCGTKKARGVLESHSIESINQRFERDLQNGTKEFYLASQDNGCYGFDKKTSFPLLVQKLLSNKGNYRIRLGMMSPQYISGYYDELVALFSDERVYKFLHLPMQSGNNRILGLMRRQYSAEQFEGLIKSLRKDIKGLCVSTDIIVGFPTETKQEFLDTLSLCQRIEFDVVNISKYGIRPGTSAAGMMQVPDKEKNLRSQELTRLCRNIFLEKNKALVGRREKILVTEKAKVNGFVGRTNSYKLVVLPSAQLNEFATARITEAFPYFVRGVVE